MSTVTTSSEARHPLSSSSPPISHSGTADAQVCMLQAKFSPACEGSKGSTPFPRGLRGDSTKARKEIVLILCQPSPPMLVIPLRSAQQFILSWGLPFEGRCPARETACKSKRRREENSDVDPSAAGDVRLGSTPSTKQMLLTNSPGTSAQAQDPQGQGFPSKGNAVTNFLIKREGKKICPCSLPGSEHRKCSPPLPCILHYLYLLRNPLGQRRRKNRCF